MLEFMHLRRIMLTVGLCVAPTIFATEPELFPIEQLKAGMKGSGTTVYSTVKGPEKFEFQILGVMRNFAGKGQDLIIAEMLGERFEKSGVVAGMSGSPAFIDGKLVGAISYGFGDFSEHAIAGISPIQTMLKIPQTNHTLAGTNTSWGTVKPLSLPLVSRGLSPSIAAYFKPQLEKHGYEVITPGAGSFNADKPSSRTLEPGGPVAAVVIDGDLSLAAIGTVTWVKGDTFLAFGHPFWQTGKSELPVATAEIVTTVFSPLRPYKMGQSGEVIGALTDDRMMGIAGKLGLKPRMTPVHVNFGDEEWNFRIGRHPTMTSMFAAMAISNSLAQRRDRELGGTYRVDLNMSLSTGDKVRLKRQVAGFGEAIENNVAQALLETFGSVMAPELKVVQIDRIDATIEYRTQVEITDLIGADFGVKAKPGTALKAQITHRPWQKKLQQKSVNVAIPKGLANGQYEVVVADRGSAIALEVGAGMNAGVQNFAELLKQIKADPTDTQACIYLQSSSKSRVVGGVPLSGLPPTLRELTSGISISPNSILSNKATKLGCVDLGQVVRGSVIGTIRIERRQ